MKRRLPHIYVGNPNRVRKSKALRCVRQKKALMQKQARDLWESAKLVAIGILLLTVIFTVPDISDTEHKSIFAIAVQSGWGQFFDWPSAWCSAKIILIALAALAFVNAVFKLLIDVEFESSTKARFIPLILPLLLAFFGVCGLIKAIL
jgi:hypothetical protein